MTDNSMILPINQENIALAARALRSGALVSFPTETVYGLGADATKGNAVANIFEAKGRPSFNPLIVHVPDIETAKRYVTFNKLAEELAVKLWPGPITMVLPRVEDCSISELASAGLPTLAIRIPANPLARTLLKEAGIPVAAPSANLSGKISPTEAQHVADDLGDKVACILDGGSCAVGLESTVISLADNKITILRPGGISREDLLPFGYPVEEAEADAEISSPGMLLSHYAPGCSVRLNAMQKNDGEAFLSFGSGFEEIEDLNLSAEGDLKEAAANLFSALHKLDKMKPTVIAVTPIPNEGIGIAINDRLNRAAAPKE
ncbi:threonylcarbamoyl-AMP synthase [Sneathiella sp. P13V-1]|uniref:L-threonylcarbamoyladenylate synthase n=1 Tax=Sneathiella sp. P13V-1 TaxID=2697366 RepID=UPI00187B16A7|nr:L-threonylcarbamoyladenylate synthase [Sneathiella sp. P13V-1]MBE7638297.1 threonylcarbamoyl-AMP synthase [Sneathiella sp. P13V-1]